MRAEWPGHLPLFVRISATDWAEAGGWTVDESVELARMFGQHGVDLVDVSSGGQLAAARTFRWDPAFRCPLQRGFARKRVFRRLP